jgi:hypothetical protein
MACERCGDPDVDGDPSRWCKACEVAYDGWSRRYAADILWAVLPAGVLVTFAGMGLPLLGASWLLAATGVFAGFGTMIGLHRLNRRRRRRQYLEAGEVPRAYLPGKTTP